MRAHDAVIYERPIWKWFEEKLCLLHSRARGETMRSADIFDTIKR